MSLVQQDILSQPNNVLFKELRLITDSGSEIDILSRLVELNIYSDISGETLSGVLVIQDSIDLLGSFTISGNESVEIRFKTPGLNKEIHIMMDVIGIEKRNFLNSMSQIYTLTLVSPEYIISEQQLISEAITGKSASEIIKYIFQKYLKGKYKASKKLQANDLIEIDSSFGEYDCVIPNLNPIHAIQWLSTKCYNATSGTIISDYVFYHNCSGFYLKSLNNLYKQETLFKYKYLQSNIRLGVEQDPEKEFYRITNLEPIHQNKIDILSGMVSSELLCHDLTNKTITKVVFDYDEYFDKINHVEKYKLKRNLSDKNGFNTKNLSNSNQILLTKSSKNYNNFSDNKEIYSQKRLYSLSSIDSNKILLNIPGNSEIRVGDMIDIFIPATKDSKEELIEQDFSSGKYLITSVRHIINKFNYSISLEASRDSNKYQLIDKSKVEIND